MERVLFADVDCVRVGRQGGLPAPTCMSSQGCGRNVLGLNWSPRVKAGQGMPALGSCAVGLGLGGQGWGGEGRGPAWPLSAQPRPSWIRLLGSW